MISYQDVNDIISNYLKVFWLNIFHMLLNKLWLKIKNILQSMKIFLLFLFRQMLLAISCVGVHTLCSCNSDNYKLS